MASNPYYNKIIIDGQTKIDLSGDTAEEQYVISGKTFHKRSGEPATGTCTYDADTSDANAAASEILKDKKAYVAGQMVTGTMPNNGAAVYSISKKDETKMIPMGYHDGSGGVQISVGDQNKLIPGNIKQGITILGVTGEYSGGTVSAEANKNVTPKFQQQVITPSEGYDYLAQVTVAAIDVQEIDNPQGGKTLTISG